MCTRPVVALRCVNARMFHSNVSPPIEESKCEMMWGGDRIRYESLFLERSRAEHVAERNVFHGKNALLEVYCKKNKMKNA